MNKEIKEKLMSLQINQNVMNIIKRLFEENKVKCIKWKVIRNECGL